MGYLGRRLALAAALVMSWVLAGALSAAPAAATVTCSFDDATDTFTITQTQESDAGQIARAGSNPWSATPAPESPVAVLRRP